MTSSLKDKLKNLDNDFSDVQEKFGSDTGNGYPILEGGDYIVDNITAKLIENTEGTLMVIRGMTILEGDLSGETGSDIMNLGSERGPEFLLKWLNFMGYTITTLSDDLEDTLEAITNNTSATAKVHVKQSDDHKYNNFYFNSLEDTGNVDDSQDIPVKESESSELDDMNMPELKEYIKEHKLSIRIKATTKKPDLIKRIQAAQQNGTPVVQQKATRKKADTNGTFRGLKTLCEEFQFKTEGIDDLEGIKTFLKSYTFSPDELSTQETELLESAGLEKLITG